MSYQIELKEHPLQHTLFIRTHSSAKALPQFFGSAYSKIFQYLSELNQQPAGMPYGAYYNMDMENLDVEAGVPVNSALPAKEEIQSGTIPQQKVATLLYTGPYEKVEPAYNAIMKWIKENDYEWTGVAYEYYLNGPDEVSSPEELQTQIVLPLVSN